ncbi:MAG: TetR/AcrR family transcriptional regulator [Archangium gephyra]|uniref:TetR/AcrR family transcriptional regulator n=1 Tax=Archangium gephyra TaxID=48 RepID=A0A2W5UI85_9BACT|nr:MAG: TetR/AcrR family transcriptional regulator [Archangium gephyra]
MNARVEQKERSREAIMASAAALLRSRGITASSVHDVMKRAGLTVGGFYGHFDSKESLFTAAIRERASAAWDVMLGGAKTVDDVLKRYVSRAHRDHPEDGCLLPSTVPDASREDGATYREALAAEVQYFAKSLVALGAQRDEALGQVALMFGALALSRALKGTPLSDEVLVAARRFARNR